MRSPSPAFVEPRAGSSRSTRPRAVHAGHAVRAAAPEAVGRPGSSARIAGRVAASSAGCGPPRRWVCSTARAADVVSRQHGEPRRPAPRAADGVDQGEGSEDGEPHPHDQYQDHGAADCEELLRNRRRPARARRDRHVQEADGEGAARSSRPRANAARIRSPRSTSSSQWCAKWLPQGMSEAELRDAVAKAIAELPQKDPKMAGRVIGAIKKQFGDRADAQLTKKLADELLRLSRAGASLRAFRVRRVQRNVQSTRPRHRDARERWHEAWNTRGSCSPSIPTSSRFG